jgi:MFS transporter, SP family, general alpha glucoside:H+ symporter
MASSSRSAGLFEQRLSRTPSPRPDPDQDPLVSERVGLLTNSLPTSTNGSFEDLPREARDVAEEQSREAMDAEHSLTVREAIRAYPMAIFWSLMVSMCVIMEGWSDPDLA